MAFWRLEEPGLRVRPRWLRALQLPFRGRWGGGGGQRPSAMQRATTGCLGRCPLLSPQPISGPLPRGRAGASGMPPASGSLGQLVSVAGWRIQGSDLSPVRYLSSSMGGVPLTRWIIRGSIEGLCGGPSVGHRNAGVGRTRSGERESSPALGVAASPRICVCVSISQVGGDSGLPHKCSKGRERMSGGWGASHQAVATP